MRKGLDKGAKQQKALIRYRQSLILAPEVFRCAPLKAEFAEEFQVVDLFSGCGGLSAGFQHFGERISSFRVVGAVDNDPVALETFAANLSAKPILADLGEVAARPRAIRALGSRLGLTPEKPLIIIGGPPCQGFSAHRKKHGEHNDVRNSLVLAFAKIAASLLPEFIIFENVPEVLSKKNWPLFSELRRRLNRSGYIVRAQVHNLAGFGVPQERFRALVVAARRPFSMPTPPLSRSRYRTVRQAIHHLKPVRPGQVAGDPMHFCASHKQSTIEVIRAVPKDGGNRPHNVGPRCLQDVDGFRDVYGRMFWDRPANTITANSRNPAGGRFVHPEQDRGLTVREAALLQGFPIDFTFAGSFDEKFRQIGNAVPPLFAAYLASIVWENIVNPHVGLRDSNQCDLNAPLSNSFSSGIAGRKNYRASS